MKMKRIARLVSVAPRGFSLIEILLVVGIMAFIAVMVAGNVVGQSEGAKIKNAATGVRLLATKAQTFYMDTGAVPTKLEELISKPANAANWRGPYISESQSKDPWNNPYVLKAPGEHGPIDVISFGADKQAGGTGDAADIGNWQ
jgi:general secretion pathway protein G